MSLMMLFNTLLSRHILFLEETLTGLIDKSLGSWFFSIGGDSSCSEFLQEDCELSALLEVLYEPLEDLHEYFEESLVELFFCKTVSTFWLLTSFPSE